MEKFQWRLQRVLDVRTKEEKKKRTDLLELTERLAATRAKLMIKQKGMADIIKSLANKKPHARLAEQEFFLVHSSSNKKQIETLRKQVYHLESEQKEKIAEIIRIKQFKEGLEKMRSDAEQKYLDEQNKFEQRELDEVATMSFVRSEVNNVNGVKP